MSNGMKHRSCPFCGHDKPLISPPVSDPPDDDTPLKAWNIVCGNEDCRVAAPCGDTEEEAWANWDKRAEDGRRCENCKHYKTDAGLRDKYCDSAEVNESFVYPSFNAEDEGTYLCPAPDFYCACWTKKEESE